MWLKGVRPRTRSWLFLDKVTLYHVVHTPQKGPLIEIWDVEVHSEKVCSDDSRLNFSEQVVALQIIVIVTVVTCFTWPTSSAAQ